MQEPARQRLPRRIDALAIEPDACALPRFDPEIVAGERAALLVAPLGLAGVDRATCILQAAMPAAVLVAIISAEHRVAPAFVTATVFFSTVLSLPVLTLLLALL